MNNIFITIGLRIAKRRRELNYSQEYLAEITGLHRTHIGFIERGEKRVSIEKLQKLACKLNISLEEIFRGY